ncbi:MAG TPA: YgdI/YgdR family lipoprotein [Pseudomonas sp.]|uniref:YgdI/YgdR family lipoprotein n=1 Tax=Pseudomonas sp. TaxID=306 RepID=UPI000EE289B5|nr:YgdI/YgdR family lipoprotein [Pseudomonas sp.]HCN64237.1 YgdI/YgdR family lipoprotein [Pseudomonas sp.]
MKISIIGLPVVIVAVLALAGCATPTVVTLQNGTQYLTKDMPNTKSTSGFYEFEDIAGKKIKVKAADVATIKANK